MGTALRLWRTNLEMASDRPNGLNTLFGKIAHQRANQSEKRMCTEPPDVSSAKQWPPGRYDIRLIFRHPSIDPEDITKTLGLEPSKQIRVGDRVIGLDGRPRRGIERQSSWSLWVTYDYEEPDLDAPGPRVDERICAFLEPIVRHAPFVRRLAVEGEAGLEINILGHSHFGCAIAPAVLRTIADLGLDLCVEVFPDSEP